MRNEVTNIAMATTMYWTNVGQLLLFQRRHFAFCFIRKKSQVYKKEVVPESIYSIPYDQL